MITEKEFEARSVEAKKEGFRRWMQEPMTKAMLSLMPPCEHMEVILQACWESGFAGGSVSTTISFLEHVMKPGPR